MRIRIDKQGCAGDARSWAVAPDLYPLDDEDCIATERFEIPAG